MIVGDCPTGVDIHARAWCAHHEYLTGGKCHVYEAEWRDANGLAFPTPDSRGTHDCARRARAAGYNVTFHPVGE
jgi:hypothetical protein